MHVCGDVRGALDLLEAVMPKRLRVQGENHPRTLATMHALAVCKGACGDVRGALDLLEAVMPKRLRVQGEDQRLPPCTSWPYASDFVAMLRGP
eukprot:TRINITY_DN7241_c0_g1_i9.p3 TRINITY_DN7241_c0_g1~~TRINITY_DN7241_c0_g1_i9.p3  ORF type:complete len:108 (-),score=14.25 TRINITY_DN7241_c0_g1_i9:203-481(-)